MRRLMISGILATLVCAAAKGDGVGESVYLGINHERLFSALGVEPRRVIIGFAEFVYPNSLGVRELSFGAYESREMAEYTFNKIYEARPTKPSRNTPPGALYCDEFYLWPSRPESTRPSASTMFRLKNVVFSFGREGSTEELLELANRIIQFIRDDRAIAPLGTFDPPPEIVDAGIPATLAVRPTERRLLEDRPWPFGEPARTVVRINPQFRGLGPVENIRLRVEIEGLGSNQVGQDGRSRDLVDVPDDAGRISRTREKSTEHDGRFLLELHRLPSGRATRKVKMIAANADNVIVTREFEIEVVPGE